MQSCRLWPEAVTVFFSSTMVEAYRTNGASVCISMHPEYDQWSKEYNAV